ncbi:hypothetical protein OQA88_2036 [Cercophora sp. LCS_1]
MSASQPVRKRKRTNSSADDARQSDKSDPHRCRLECHEDHVQMVRTVVSVRQSVRKLERAMSDVIFLTTREKEHIAHFNYFSRQSSDLRCRLAELSEQVSAICDCPFDEPDPAPGAQLNREVHAGVDGQDAKKGLTEAAFNKHNPDRHVFDLFLRSTCAAGDDIPVPERTDKPQPSPAKETPNLLTRKCRCRSMSDEARGFCNDACSCKESGVGCGIGCGCWEPTLDKIMFCNNPFSSHDLMEDLFGFFHPPPFATVIVSPCFAKWFTAKANRMCPLDRIADMIADRYEEALSVETSNTPTGQLVRRWKEVKAEGGDRFEQMRAGWELMRATVTADANDEVVGRYSFCFERFGHRTVHHPKETRCEDEL